MRLTRREFAAAAAVGAAGCLADGTETVESLPTPVAGDPDADVTVTVYEDFGCGGCQHYQLRIAPAIKEEYVDPGLIRYERRDFPIPASDWSWPVASAARSVQDHEGDAAFWEFTDEIYRHLGRYSYDLIEAVAGELGLDGERTREAAEAETYRPVLEDDRERGEEIGVRATPTILVDGRPVETTISDVDGAIADVEAAIEAAVEG